MKIKIGTRKSKLAMWQAEWASGRLTDEGYSVEVIPIETKGDKILDVTISKIGSKGVFTEELEQMLSNQEIDVAIHSAKDIQSQLPEEFELLAFSDREVVNDVIVSLSEFNENKMVIGTSSTRRVAFMKNFFPQFEVVDMRGNLQTRIRKMKDGHCDGLMLAAAGVLRMNYQGMISKYLDTNEFIPAVGQGSIAVQCHKDLSQPKKQAIRDVLNNEQTERTILCERSFLAAMDGGCSIPIFGLATKQEKNLALKGGIISLNGSRKVVKEVTGSIPSEIGMELAEKVLASGGDKILAEIKETLSN